MPIDEHDTTRYVAFGATKGMWWLVSSLFSLLCLGAAWWLTAVQARQEVVAQRVYELQEARGEDRTRLSLIEATTSVIAKDVDKVSNNVDRINTKIDTILIQQQQERRGSQ